MDSRRHVICGLLAGLIVLAFAGGDGKAVGEMSSPSPQWITRSSGGALSFPSDIAIDRRGVVFLLDSGTRTISIFTPEGKPIREIAGSGRWRDPVSLALSPDGTMFVADGEAARVLEIDRGGNVLREYPAGKDARVTGVAVYGDSIYCTDNRNARVIVFHRGGGKSGGWGKRGSGPGEFLSPFRIVADSGGRIFVSDVLNGRVQWFSAFGRHLGTLKAFGAAQGKFFRPTGIAVDPRGRIWVADSFTGLVQLFTEESGGVRTLEDREGPVRFGDPTGIAVGPNGIWVADQREGRVGWIRNTGRREWRGR